MKVNAARVGVLLLLAVAGSLVALSWRTRAQQMSPTSEPAVLASAAGPILVGQKPVRIVLQPVKARSLSDAMQQATGDQRLYLVVRDLRAAQQPGVPFLVYLDLAAAPGSAASMSHLVATLNFFGSPEPGRDVGGSDLFNSYDITDAVRRLQAEKALQIPTTLTVAPVGVPLADSRATLGGVDLMVQ